MTEDYDYESLGSNSTVAQNALAGALAGIGEHCAMYPVDSIKTRMQVIQPINPSTHPPKPQFGINHHRQVHSLALTKHINTTHLWRGVHSVILGAGPAHAVHFATYEACKSHFGGSFLSNAAAAATATFAHDFLMNPFDVIKQRMQLIDYPSIRHCVRHVVTREGLSALYLSLPTTLMLSVPFQSVQFASYEILRARLNPEGLYDPVTHAVAGGLAGALASSVTTPLDVCKTLLQTRGSHVDPKVRQAAGLAQAARLIYDRYGYRGFFRGFRPRILTHMPSAAISWSVYEYFKWFIGQSDHLFTL